MKLLRIRLTSEMGLACAGSSESDLTHHLTVLMMVWVSSLQVLIRRTGIPITLAVVQCSVGVRCGMHLRAVGMPCHLLTKLGEPGDPEETFIDCFDSGRMMTRPVSCLRLWRLALLVRELTRGDDGGGRASNSG